MHFHTSIPSKHLLFTFPFNTHSQTKTVLSKNTSKRLFPLLLLTLTLLPTISSASPSTLHILHFNDVYNILPATNDDPVSQASKFVTLFNSFNHLSPLKFFTGDFFSPSSLSGTYKGQHMVEPLNLLNLTAATYGNHDFGVPLSSMSENVQNMNHPWLLTNVDYLAHDGVFRGYQRYLVVDYAPGWRVGLIGLVSEIFYDMPYFKRHLFRVHDPVEIANNYSRWLREEKEVDFVIALTHMEWSEDEQLAKYADVDLILAGHNHDYMHKIRHGKVIVKSGYDFNEFSCISIGRIKWDLEDCGDGNVEGQCSGGASPVKLRPGCSMENLTEYISGSYKIFVSRIEVTQDIEGDERMNEHVKSFESGGGGKLAAIKCDFKARQAEIRVQETALTNLFADLFFMYAYPKVDAVAINTGDYRSDSWVPSSHLSSGDISKLFSFNANLCIAPLNGSIVLKLLETGLRLHPLAEGAFLAVSNIRFAFKRDNEAGRRVLEDSVTINGEPLDPEKTYNILLTSFLIGGGDGFTFVPEALEDVQTECIGGEQDIIKRVLMALNGRNLEVLDECGGEISHGDECNLWNSSAVVNFIENGLVRQHYELVEDDDGEMIISLCPVTDGRIQILWKASKVMTSMGVRLFFAALISFIF